MDKFKIVGGTPLQAAKFRVSGSKNSALPALAACLLTEEPVTLHRIPQVKDIATMESLLTLYGRAGVAIRVGSTSALMRGLWTGRKRPTMS